MGALHNFLPRNYKNDNIFLVFFVKIDGIMRIVDKNHGCYVAPTLSKTMGAKTLKAPISTGPCVSVRLSTLPHWFRQPCAILVLFCSVFGPSLETLFHRTLYLTW